MSAPFIMSLPAASANEGGPRCFWGGLGGGGRAGWAGLGCCQAGALLGEPLLIDGARELWARAGRAGARASYCVLHCSCNCCEAERMRETEMGF